LTLPPFDLRETAGDRPAVAPTRPPARRIKGVTKTRLLQGGALFLLVVIVGSLLAVDWTPPCTMVGCTDGPTYVLPDAAFAPL